MQAIWHDMFHLGVPLAEKVLRTVGVYLFLIVSLRLAGKRELAQLNPFDFIVLLLLSNTVQNAIIGDDDSLLGGLVGAIVLLALNYGLVRFFYRRQKLDEIIEGDEDVLIEHGKIRKDRLRHELIRLQQLRAAARKQGFASLEEVDKAVLEPGGTLVFVGKDESPADRRHQELLDRLDRLSTEVAALKAKA